MKNMNLTIYYSRSKNFELCDRIETHKFYDAKQKMFEDVNFFWSRNYKELADDADVFTSKRYVLCPVEYIYELVFGHMCHLKKLTHLLECNCTYSPVYKQIFVEIWHVNRIIHYLFAKIFR